MSRSTVSYTRNKEASPHRAGRESLRRRADWNGRARGSPATSRASRVLHSRQQRRGPSTLTRRFHFRRHTNSRMVNLLSPSLRNLPARLSFLVEGLLSRFISLSWQSHSEGKSFDFRIRCSRDAYSVSPSRAIRSTSGSFTARYTMRWMISRLRAYQQIRVEVDEQFPLVVLASPLPVTLSTSLPLPAVPGRSPA